MGKIAGTTVLIFGGSSGIGFGVAKQARENGANVIITSSNESRISKAVERLQSTPAELSVTVKGIACDLSKDTVEDELDKLFSTIGPVNHVVYSAADSLARSSLEETTLPFIIKAGHMRFVVPLLVGKKVLQHVPKTEKSSYTFTTGAVSQRPNPGWTVIGSYAAGHHGMVRQLALDLAPTRVNLVSPGPINTELWGTGKEKDDIVKSFGPMTVLGRVGEPEDVAEAYLYFMRNDYATGGCVDVNGGLLLR